MIQNREDRNCHRFGKFNPLPCESTLPCLQTILKPAEAADVSAETLRKAPCLLYRAATQDLIEKIRIGALFEQVRILQSDIQLAILKFGQPNVLVYDSLGPRIPPGGQKKCVIKALII